MTKSWNLEKTQIKYFRCVFSRSPLREPQCIRNFSKENIMSNLKKILKEYNFFYGTSFIILFVFLFSPFFTFSKFADPYTTIKWILVIFSSNIILFLFLFKSKFIIFPKIPSFPLYILFFVLFIIILNSYIHNVSLISYENIRRFMFWAISLFYFNFFFFTKEKGFATIEKTIFLSSSVFLILSLAQYILHPDSPPYLTFGNINLSSEFIGFSLAFQFGFLFRAWQKKQKSRPLNLLAALSLTYIYITNCRSVFIGSFLIIIFSMILNRKMFKENIKIIILAVVFVFSIKKIILFLYPDMIFITFVEKGSSARWLIYTNTLQMILENSLGVGVGQFEYASLPYLGSLFPTLNEWLLFSTPHDEFLRYLAEDGIIFSVSVFLFFISLLYFSWKEIKKVVISQPHIVCFFIMLFTQALFQFPLLDPLPYFMTALMVGYFFYLLPIGKLKYELKQAPRVALIGINGLATFLIVAFFSAKYISLNYPYNEFLNKLACSYGNRNWLACLNVSHSYLSKADYDKAESYAVRTLEWQPLNYQGLKLLGFSHLYRGNRRKACQLFHKFDSLFQNQSSLHKVILEECTSIEAPLALSYSGKFE